MKRGSNLLLWKFWTTSLVSFNVSTPLFFSEAYCLNILIFQKHFSFECFEIFLLILLNSLSGVAQGSLCSTAEAVFQYLAPVLSEFSTLIGLYHNYQNVVELILELHVEAARRILSYLNQVGYFLLFCLFGMCSPAPCVLDGLQPAMKHAMLPIERMCLLMYRISFKP